MIPYFFSPPEASPTYNVFFYNVFFLQWRLCFVSSTRKYIFLSWNILKNFSLIHLCINLIISYIIIICDKILFLFEKGAWGFLYSWIRLIIYYHSIIIFDKNNFHLYLASGKLSWTLQLYIQMFLKSWCLFSWCLRLSPQSHFTCRQVS